MKQLPTIGLMIVILIYAVVAFTFSEVTPFNKGPDEGANLAHVEFIAKNGRLTKTYEERAMIGNGANMPVLFHLYLAWLSRALGVDVSQPPDIKIFWDSFRYRAIDTQAENVWYLLTEDQDSPYYGLIFVLHLGRWLSIIINAFTILVTYFIALEFFPQKRWLALAAATILAFIPTFVFMSSVLNEDALVALTAAIYFWMLIRIIKQPSRILPYWVAGLAMGLSVATKYTAIVLPLEVVLIFALVAHQHQFTWMWWLKRVTIVAVGAIFATAWYFVWNIWYLNDVVRLGWLAGLSRPFLTGGVNITMARMGHYISGGEIGVADIPADQTRGLFSTWAWKTLISVWGESIGGIPWYPYVYIIVFGLMIAAAVGTWKLWRTESTSRQWVLLLGFHILLFLMLPLLRFWTSRRIGETAQGRHLLIPAASAIIILLVWGLSKVVSQRMQKWFFSVIILFFMIWTGAHVYRLATGSSLLPLRTLPRAAEWLPNPADIRFGDTLELVSYDISPEPQQGILNLDLAWRSLAYTNESYLLTVELVDAQGKVVSHWIGYNGQGRLPTVAWDPGDSVFDRLKLPLSNLPVGEYQVRIQVMGNTGPLPVSNSQDVLMLPQFALDEPSELEFGRRIGAKESSNSEIMFALWNANGPVEANEWPTYRYPGTISVVIPADVGKDVQAELIDPNDQPRSPTQIQAGIYNFVIGSRWPSGDYRLQLSAESGSEITSGPLLTVENWWPRLFEAPNIETPVTANFANQVYLLGYKLPQTQIEAGESFPVTFYWQAPQNRSPQANFIQFNHLLDQSGNLYGGYDRRPLEYYSTLLWAPGEVVIDGYTVPVAPDAPPGNYYLDVGYYLIVGESSVNLPIVIDGEMSEISSVTIGPIEVVENFD